MSEVNNPVTNDEELNDVVEEEIDDAEVMTVPIDDTLTVSGEAADAKAVGDALALKADKSELASAINVNGQGADAQGLIILLAGHIPVSDAQGAQTIAQALTALAGRTGADIPVSGETGAQSIQEALNAATAQTADYIKMSSAEGADTVAQAMEKLTRAVGQNADAIVVLNEKTGASILLNGTSTQTIEEALEALSITCVKSVNGLFPDSLGNLTLQTVPLAVNLTTEDTKQESGTFLRRTTAGSASINDGKAWVNRILGNSVHTGFVEESLEMTVIPVERAAADTEEEGEGGDDPEPETITATIDRDTFVAYVTQSGTIDLYYTTEWSADPTLYGITVTGTPAAGDHIQVVYVKEVRGTITMATPSALVATGWNLFERSKGYARVVKYSSDYGYKVGGTYTALTFKEALTDVGVAITPDENGLFNVTKDGYVVVTGGSTDTYILTTWSDWTGGPSGGYRGYTESRVSLATIMTECFPNGLMKVGSAQDEIDRNAQTATSWVQRIAYSEEARAEAEASELAYDFDENYIYIEREDPVVTHIQLVGEYDINEHGLEFFDGTTIPVSCEILYGENLKDKLRRDVVTYDMTVAELEGMGS